MKKLFSFSRTTANRIVKQAFPDLSPHYFRRNRILKSGGYYTAAEEFGLSHNNRTRYSKGWNQIKKERISEFENICPITGESDNLHVHHIDFNKENDDSENLIPLWSPLHTLIHARAGFSSSYEVLDKTVFSSIIKVWCRK